jgi:asparagine synthase (glutamine-hydrolysing)
MLDIRTSLADEMLAKVDRATMASGVEARVPLLDHRIVELAMRMPAHLKIAGGEGKWILKRVGERHVPNEVLHRPKRGFEVPLSGWLRDRSVSAREALSASVLRRAGVLRDDAVAGVLALHEASPGFASSHMVLTLLCLQAWLDTHRSASG